MSSPSLIKKLVVGAAAAGTLSLGTVGIAAATSPPTTPSTSPAPALSPSTPATGARRHFTCADAPKALARIEKVEARIAAGLPKLTAAEQKAQQAGNTKRAARLQKVIARLESPAFKARLDKRTQRIEAVCHVDAPAAPTAPTAPGSSTSGGTGSTTAVQA